MSAEKFSSIQKDPHIPVTNPAWRPDPIGYLKNFPEMSLVWAGDIRHCISNDIFINPLAADMLPQSHKYLASEDFLANHALLTAPPRKSVAAFITQKNWTRALISAQETVPYNNQIGRFIMSKGNSMSGNQYGKYQEPVNDPRGFYGAADARKELQIGNELLENNFRASMPLGFLTLDPEKLRNSVSQLWQVDPTIRDNILVHLDKVRQNKDMPAILVRLTGCRTRFVDSITEANFPAIVNGLSTLPEIPERVINEIFNRRVLSTSDIFQLSESINQLIEQNTRALRKSMPNFRNFSKLDDTLSAPKDLDSTFSIQDYEESNFYVKDLPNDAAILEYHDYFVVENYKNKFKKSVVGRMKSILGFIYKGKITQVLIDELNAQLV